MQCPSQDEDSAPAFSSLHYLPSVSWFSCSTICPHSSSYLQAQPHNMFSTILLSQEVLEYTCPPITSNILTVKMIWDANHLKVKMIWPTVNMRLLRCEKVTLAILLTQDRSMVSKLQSPLHIHCPFLRRSTVSFAQVIFEQNHSFPSDNISP